MYSGHPSLSSLCQRKSNSNMAIIGVKRRTQEMMDTDITSKRGDVALPIIFKKFQVAS